MENQYSRTELIYGESAIAKFRKARVAVFGLGGVGSYAVEALARAGIGTLDLIDFDTINVSNINRQLYALQSTIGLLKTKVAKNRIHDINPEIQVNTYNEKILPETADNFDFSAFDYVVDAIDNVSGKITLVLQAKKSGIPVISAMGTGRKKNPCLLKVEDIYKTSVCPLARIMRTELKKRNVESLTVVYSTEKPALQTQNNIIGSNSFVPACAGLMLAAEVINYLAQQE